MSSVPDEYEDLIGELPEDEIAPESIYPPAAIDRFGQVDEGTQRWWLRELAKLNPPLALDALLPEYEKREQVETAQEFKRLRARHRAKELLAEFLGADDAVEPPSLVSLSDFLAEPDEDVRYRVDGLWPSGGRIVLAAQNKTGKTTMTGNLIRSLADGEKFLDAYDVERAERVLLLDNEMSPNQIRRWLRDQGIVNTDAVELVSLRGRLSSFNILDPTVRAEWARLIGPADVLIFDCLRPALDALGLSEDKESGRFLEALDELLVAAGIAELLVVHHMGHSNERSRGDSRLEDWPDAKWKLLKADAEDPTSDRYFAAFGRDVDQAEVRLGFDSETRHLSVNGGSRRQATASRIEYDVLAYIAEHPGCGMNDLKVEVDGDNVAKMKAVKTLLRDGALVMRKIGQKHTHYIPSDAPADQQEQA